MHFNPFDKTLSTTKNKKSFNIHIMDNIYTVGSTWYAEPAENYTQYRVAQILQTRKGKASQIECYVHYVDFDRRLDEWVSSISFLMYAIYHP